MSAGREQPDALELVRTVAELLRDAVQPAVEGALGFQVRVARSALSIAARELELADQHEGMHAQRLAALGVQDDESLARRVQSGELDHDYGAVVAALRQDVWERLSVVNPRYAEPYDDPLAAAEA